MSASTVPLTISNNTKRPQIQLPSPTVSPRAHRHSLSNDNSGILSLSNDHSYSNDNSDLETPTAVEHWNNQETTNKSHISIHGQKNNTSSIPSSPSNHQHPHYHHHQSKSIKNLNAANNVAASSYPVNVNSTNSTSNALSHTSFQRSSSSPSSHVSSPSSPIASASPSSRRYQPLTVPKLPKLPPSIGQNTNQKVHQLSVAPKSPRLFSPTFHNRPGALDEVGVEARILVAKREELKDTLKHMEEIVATIANETSTALSSDKEHNTECDEIMTDASTTCAIESSLPGADSAGKTILSELRQQQVSGSVDTHYHAATLAPLVLMNSDNSDEDDEPLTGTYSCPSTPSHRSLSDIDEFDPFLFIKSLPNPLPRAPSHNNSWNKPSFVLPAKSCTDDRPTLVLDLDETLVHCSISPLSAASFIFPVTFNGNQYQVYVRLRPHLHRFLAALAPDFELCVFTASQAVYADSLLNLLDPSRSFISHRVFRDSCVCYEGNYLKDLTILGRDLSQTAIIDNSIQAFALQLDNGIPITSWYEDPSDEELLHLLPFLKKLRKQKDMRPFLKSFFHLTDFVDSLGGNRN